MLYVSIVCSRDESGSSFVLAELIKMYLLRCGLAFRSSNKCEIVAIINNYDAIFSYCWLTNNAEIFEKNVIACA